MTRVEVLTPRGRGAVSVVRVRGPGARELVTRLAVPHFTWNLQSGQVLWVLGLALLLHYGTRARQLGTQLLRLPGWAQGAAWAAAAALIYLASGRTGEFIYFQF